MVGDKGLLRMRRKARTYISDKPAVYLPLARKQNGDFVVNRETEICIEGYPRSANSFAEAAFRVAQGRPLRMAHHCHAAAQVIAAARWAVPTIVTIRQPLEAVRSLLMHDADLFCPAMALREYVLFHRRIEPVRSSFVLAHFDAVTRDFGDVIRAVNTRFGSQFKVLEMNAENLHRVFEELDRLSLQRGTVDERGEPYSIIRPKAELVAREERKRVVQQALEEDGTLQPLREAATEIYQSLISTADV